jgi:hypothetical protein
MSVLLTKREVAELMGWSKRYVEIRARELGVQRNGHRARNGKATPMFPLANLPAEAQTKWIGKTKPPEPRHGIALVPTPAETALVPEGQMALALTTPGQELALADRDQALKRYGIIAPLVEREKHAAVWKHCGNTADAVVEFLARQHGHGNRTLYRWCAQFRRSGLAGLVDRTRADKGQARALNQASLSFLIAAALPKRGEYGKLTVAEIFRAHEEEREWRARHPQKFPPSLQLTAASYRSFCLWFDRIPEIVKTMAREGQKAYQDTQEMLSWRDLSSLRCMDWVVMDHRCLDLFCLVPRERGWALARPWLTAALDMRARKWLAWKIVEQPSSVSIAAVMKRCFLDHGLPGHMYWDNGKDFRAQWLEGRQVQTRQVGAIEDLDTTWNGVLASLGVRVTHAIPLRARSKIIEANFRATALYDQTTPWWCGHSPDTRPEDFERLVHEHEMWTRGQRAETPFPTLDQVAVLYDELLTSLNSRPHCGEGMQKIVPAGQAWMTPNECWTKHAVEPRRVDPVQIQFGFLKRRPPQLVTNGEVQATFGGRAYHYRMIDNPLRLMGLNGQQVQIAYDPLDLGTVAIYRDDVLVGLAHNIELRRMGESDFIADERGRRAARREVKAFIERIHATVEVPGTLERARRRAAGRAQEQGSAWETAPSSASALALQAPSSASALALQAPNQLSEPGLAGRVETAVSAAESTEQDDGGFDLFAEA